MASSDADGPYILGIDLGTTSVKVALIDTCHKTVKYTKCHETHASMPSDVGACGNEQDTSKIVTALQFCLSGLPKEALMKIAKIGVSGQMHGVLMWKHGYAWTRNSFGRFDLTEHVSQLFTWQDGRCSREFLSTLPEPNSHTKLATGFGCATIFWLLYNRPNTLVIYDRAGTIQDFVVSMLASSAEVYMSVQNAASWGYFDCVDMTWNIDILRAADFPVHLLPKVLQVGSLSGYTAGCWYGVPSNTPVYVAMGDLQCSVLAHFKKPNDAVLNISTSAELAFQSTPGFVVQAGVDYVPFFGGSYLAVAASLNGGNVLQTFVRMLQQWSHELGLGIPENKIWNILEIRGRESVETDLLIEPRLFGERHLPDCRASVGNISALNTGLGSVYRTLCRALISNLHDMMPRSVLQATGIQRIVASGNAIAKNAMFSDMIAEQYEMDVVIFEGAEADAAVGAALSLVNNDTCHLSTIQLGQGNNNFQITSPNQT